MSETPPTPTLGFQGLVFPFNKNGEQNRLSEALPISNNSNITLNYRFHRFYC